MHSITRRKTLGGGAAVLGLVLSVILMVGLFVSTAGISMAQVDGDHDKIAVQKVAVHSNIQEGAVAAFVITLTTRAPFLIDGVVLTDVLPPGGPWTVTGDGNLASPNCNGTYAGGATLTCNFGTLDASRNVVTRTLTVSAPTSDPNCDGIRNTASVRVAASEGETLLANNVSTATVNVRCGQRMTGGGSIIQQITASESLRVTHGFELHCNRTDDPNNLEINWIGFITGVENNFHLQSLTSARCSDDPAITPNPPGASFDTYVGTGTGLCNGLPASISFRLTDAGEPGTSDTAQYTISGGCTLSAGALPLTFGNHQAH